MGHFSTFGWYWVSPWTDILAFTLLCSQYFCLKQVGCNLVLTKIYFQCHHLISCPASSGESGIGSGPLISTHVQAWHMVQDYCCCTVSKFFNWPYLFQNCPKYRKNVVLARDFSKAQSQTGTILLFQHSFSGFQPPFPVYFLHFVAIFAIPGLVCSTMTCSIVQPLPYSCFWPWRYFIIQPFFI